MNELITYADWLKNLKERVKSVQHKIVLYANIELVCFYWDLGEEIYEKQQHANWGTSLIETLSKDLKAEFPDMAGFSTTNLYNCVKFFKFFSSPEFFQRSVGEIENKTGFLQRTVAKLPWRHIIQLISKTKTIDEALFFVEQTIDNGWSMDMLALQIKTRLYERQGKSITNFLNTLPSPSSDLAQQTLKDPYIFDFVNMTAQSKERDIENQLTQNITRFLLELGKGFAFIGRQFQVQLLEKEYFIDLLFYHIPMQCYVVIELKNKDFEPEYVGKLNFYLTLIDRTLKRPTENPSIGILLCRGKNNLEVEYALQDIHKPMGVSEFKLSGMLPDNLKSNLPSIEELEEQLKKLDD